MSLDRWEKGFGMLLLVTTQCPSVLVVLVVRKIAVSATRGIRLPLWRFSHCLVESRYQLFPTLFRLATENLGYLPGDLQRECFHLQRRPEWTMETQTLLINLNVA